ncbi:hypothetical protein [Streptomyces sp. NPDC008240]|uniref:hypothetical protein n=1 Tax=Streptomyces sp. NPDC008240 TaxID=3364822 RepID=UPI0036F056F8
MVALSQRLLGLSSVAAAANAAVRAFALDAFRRLDAIEEEDSKQEADFRRGYRR